MESRNIQKIKQKIAKLSKEEFKKYEQSDLEEAKSLNFEMLKLSEKIGDRKVVASVYSKLANISITNFGKQIPPEIQNNIFDKNFSFGASANTGLGLFIVKNILKSYGGNITLRKSDGESTEFIITLRSG